MKKMKLITAVCLSTMLLTQTAVFAESTDTKDTAAESTAAEKKTLGTKEEGAYEVEVKNATGREIAKVAIRKSSETEYDKSLMEEGDVFAVDEVRVLYFKPAESEEAKAEEAKAEETKEDEKVITPSYDIQITFKDDNTSLAIHQFPFEDVEGTANLVATDGVAFLMYKSKANKSAEVSTQEQEKAAYEIEAKAKAEAEETAAGESAPAAEAVQEAPAEEYYEEPVYEEYNEEPVYEEYYEEPVYEDYSGDGGDGGGEDGCLEDGLTF